MARGDGSLFKQRNSDVFWCCYYLRGKRFRQSTHETDEAKARKVLENKIMHVHADKIGARTLVTPKTARLTVHDLLERLKTKYELHVPRQDSPQNLSHLKRADADFGDRLAIGLDADAFDEYKKRRRAAGDALASIQRILQMLRAAYLRAVKHDKFPAHSVPFIEVEKENNARRDCYKEAEFRMIYKNLPPYLADFALFAVRTGMRFSEICSLQWENVKGDVIELRGADAKGDGSEEYARLIPMAGKDLAGILERREKARKMKHKGTVTLAEFVFHHNGKRIMDIRKAWRSAIRKAGLRHLVFHTLRHSAVRIMDDAGISRDAAMSITGHTTQAMYTRYNFSDVDRKRNALKTAQEFAEVLAAKEPAAKAVAMRR